MPDAVVTYHDDDPSAHVPQVPIEQTPLDRIAALLSGGTLDDRANVRLYRFDGDNTSKLTWCKNYAVSDFETGDLEMIRSEWGPGDYQIRLYGYFPDGSFGVRGRENIRIAAPLNYTPTQNHAPQQQQQQNTELTAMLKVLSENQAAMLKALSEKPDPMAQMTQSFALIGQLKEVFGAPQQPQKSSIGEVVEAIKELQGASSIVNPDKGDPGDGGMLTLAASVMEMIKAQQKPQGPVLMPDVVAPGFIADSAQQPQENPIPAGESEDMNALAKIAVRGYLGVLINMAKSNKPVTEGVEFIYRKLPDEMIPLVQLETWFEMLCEFQPACKEHQIWLTAARDGACAMFAEDEANESADLNERVGPGA